MKNDWPTKKLEKSKIDRGGDAGEVFIAAKKIVGTGKITADGGDGSIGGKGGKVTIISEDNRFAGQVSARGGKSFSRTRQWYEKWWGILILGIIASSIAAIIFYFL